MSTNVTVLSGRSLQDLMEMLTGTRNLPGSLYRLRIRQLASGRCEFKVNDSGEWANPMGYSDMRQKFGTASCQEQEIAEVTDLLHSNPWDETADEFGTQIQAQYDARFAGSHGLDTDSSYANRLRSDSKGGF